MTQKLAELKMQLLSNCD